MKYISARNILLGALLFLPSFALAQKLPNFVPGAGSTLQDFVNLLIDIVQWVALPALALAIIYAGFVLVSAGGNDEQITKGKRWILWTLVGAAIILGAHVIANIVFGTAKLF
jgi:hypothetical protein